MSAGASQLTGKLLQKQCEDVTPLAQQLQNGRSCQYAGQCISRQCDGRCKGLELGGSCSNHTDCDVGMACLASGQWPFLTTCQKLNGVGAACGSDFECAVDGICWAGTCQGLYQYAKGTTFNHTFGVNVTNSMALSLNAGRLCQSAFAYFPVNSTTAVCVEVMNISSNVDNWATGVPLGQPYKDCLLNQTVFANRTVSQACRYLISLAPNVTVYVDDPCQCTLSNDLQQKQRGICQLPPQAVLTQYGSAIRGMLQGGAS